MKFCLICENEFKEECLKNCICLKCMFKGQDFISKFFCTFKFFSLFSKLFFFLRVLQRHVELF